MKPNHISTTLAALISASVLIATAWGGSARLRAEYQNQLDSLKENFERILPKPDERVLAAFNNALEEESAAQNAIEEAKERRGKYDRARGLVDHARNHWISRAETNLAGAKERLENASNADERREAEKEVAKWEENRQDGLDALEERKAKLEEAERDRPAAKKAYEDARQQLEEAQGAVITAMNALGINEFLADDTHDANFAKFIVLNDATPAALASFAARGIRPRGMIDRMLGDEHMLVQMAVADGANDGNYIRAMEILHDIEAASPKAKEEGPLQRLALAIALEHATPVAQRNAVADTDAPDTVDPVGRYLQFEEAYLADELDPGFATLTVWDMRMVVDGEEPDEISRWGREMLRSYRPDHITTSNQGWRYVALVRSDIPYGSSHVKYDRDDLHFFQNILMNGGICGRRAFIGRFLLRSHGMPTIARPQTGHASLARWTPDGWVINLGGGWGHGWTRTAYRDDRDFLATTQARALGDHFLQVKRARWIGEVMGENRVWGHYDRVEPEFWHSLALNIQRHLIEAADAQTLGPLGEDIAEATETREHIEIPDVHISDRDRRIRVEDGLIRIPAAATSRPTGSGNGIQFMDSFLGGTQLHYGRAANNPSFEYAVQSRNRGKYALFARVATASWRQSFEVTVNGDTTVRMPLPHTVGLWQATEPVEIDLNNGRNVLEFKRDYEGRGAGISISEFVLVPWEMRDNVELWQDDSSAGEPTIPAGLRRALGTSLLRDLVNINANGGFKSLPLDLSISRSRVHLVDASGSSVLAFQAPDGGQIARVALDDLKDEDHVLLSRFVARQRPDDPDANARAASYLEALGQSAVAETYREKAGPEAVERFAALEAGS